MNTQQLLSTFISSIIIIKGRTFKRFQKGYSFSTPATELNFKNFVRDIEYLRFDKCSLLFNLSTFLLCVTNESNYLALLEKLVQCPLYEDGQRIQCN